MRGQAVLFDAGGTLIHMDRRFFIRALNANGVTADHDALSRAELVARAEIARILRSDDPGTDASRWAAYSRVLMRELRCEGAALDRVRAALRARHESGDLWTYVEAGTVETLQLLQAAGIRMGVVSNADGRVASFLEKAGLDGFFEFILDSGIFGIEKPDARIFLHACEQLGTDPGHTLYVGDVYEVDALGARGAGLMPVIISSTAQPDWDCGVIQSITELPPYLDIPLRPAVR